MKYVIAKICNEYKKGQVSLQKGTGPFSNGDRSKYKKGRGGKAYDYLKYQENGRRHDLIR